MRTKIIPLDKYKDFDSAYWGMGSCSDGNIYFGLCSHIPSKSAGFFRFNPRTDIIDHLFNVDEILGSTHGKIHTPILEAANKKLYFGTHFAYPFGDPSQPVEYAGGHLVSFDPTSEETEDLGIVSPGEGILTIALDKKGGKIYSLTVPSGVLAVTDIVTRKTKRLGQIPSKGSICRTIAVDGQGKVYGSYESNGLFVYDADIDKLMFKDNFFPSEEVKEWDDASRGGVNKIGRNLWRCVEYDEQQNALYGIYSASSKAFMIDCQTLELKMFDELVPRSFSSSDSVYPTLTMVSTVDKLFYAAADGMFDYCRSDNLKNYTNLMVFDKRTGQISTLGEISDEGVRVYGAAGATLGDTQIYLLGATEAQNSQHRSSDKEESLFRIGGTPMNLSFIKVSSSNL